MFRKERLAVVVSAAIVVRKGCTNVAESGGRPKCLMRFVAFIQLRLGIKCRVALSHACQNSHWFDADILRTAAPLHIEATNVL